VAVMAIERAAYEFPWTEGIFRDCLRVGYCCWVLEEAGRLRGYGIMSVGAGEAHLLNLCIAPEAQRRGLGRRLLRHLLALARGWRARRPRARPGPPERDPGRGRRVPPALARAHRAPMLSGRGVPGRGALAMPTTTSSRRIPQ